MSKKRDSNKRKKQVKARMFSKKPAKKVVAANILGSLSFRITDDPVDDQDVRALPSEVQEQIESLYERVQFAPQGTVEEIHGLIDRFPHIPQLRNYLYAAYASTGEIDKAAQIVKENYKTDPSYLFAKLNYAEHLIKSGEIDKVAEIFNDKLDLSELYPERDKFHTSEVTSFYGVVGYYCAMTGRRDNADHCLKILYDVSADHGYTSRLERKLKSLDTFTA